MKYLKRTLALLLALLLLFAGCSNNAASTTEPKPFVPPNSVPMLGGDTKPTEQQDLGSVQYLPEEVENPDGLPVLKWLCLSASQKSDAAMAEINRVLAEKNMPFRLQFVLYSADGNSDPWFTLDEVVELAGEADLISGHIRTEDAVQYLAPITENATGAAEPSLENAFIHSYYYGRTTVDGIVYAIPGMTTELAVGGWCVKNSVLTDGITAEDFAHNYWEMDDVFARIYANNNNEPFLSPLHKGVSYSEKACLPTSVSLSFCADFEELAACYGIDYTLETPTVVNILEMEQIRLVQAAMVRYTEAGYFVTEDERSSATIQYATLHADFPYTRGDKQYIPVGKIQALCNVPAGNMTGVSAASKNKDEALALLALMADDLEFRKLLFFGREGQEYQIEDGMYRTIPDENGNVYSMLLLSGLVDFCGVKLDYHEKYFPTPEGESLSESYFAMLERSVIRYPLNVWYGFDTSAVDEEIKAVNKLLGVKEDDGQPSSAWEFTTSDPEAYDEFLQKVKDAGGDKIQAELQRQLDAWLAENPGWE